MIAAEQELGLASPSTPEPWDGLDPWADLISGDGGPGSADPLLGQWIMHRMGLADQPAGPVEPSRRVDVTSIRAELGI